MKGYTYEIDKPFHWKECEVEHLDFFFGVYSYPPYFQERIRAIRWYSVGVYFLLGEKLKTLYVGKSTDLRTRIPEQVRSKFFKKQIEFVGGIFLRGICLSSCYSELDILENLCIIKFSPVFNKLLTKEIDIIRCNKNMRGKVYRDREAVNQAYSDILGVNTSREKIL